MTLAPIANTKEMDWLARRQKALKLAVCYNASTAGRGIDPHTPNDTFDHAMAYALYASSCAVLGLLPEAKAAAKWLEQDAASKKGNPGWGLPFRWAAFGNGETNPVEAIYGITSALAVRGLVDVACATGEPVSDCVIQFLDKYLQCSSETEHGIYFWYSDQPADAQSVFNVTSMLAGQYARIGHLLRRDDYRSAASRAASDLLAHRRDSERGDYWDYGEAYPRPNDAVHAAYTVQGLLEVQRWTDADFQLEPAVRYLRKFFRAGQAFEFVRHRELPRDKLLAPARLWGVGMLLFTACEANDNYLRGLAEAALEGYSDGAGRYYLSPVKKVVYPRHELHALFGLARAAALN